MRGCFGKFFFYFWSERPNDLRNNSLFIVASDNLSDVTNCFDLGPPDKGVTVIHDQNIFFFKTREIIEWWEPLSKCQSPST